MKSKWRCDECGELYDWQFAAQDCCQPQTSEVYVCPVCEDEHMQECEALECCGHDMDAHPPPSARELEAMGQIRLVL